MFLLAVDLNMASCLSRLVLDSSFLHSSYIEWPEGFILHSSALDV